MPDETRAETIYAALFETEFPMDFALALAWLAAAILSLFIPILSESPVRILLALPVALFLPGYGLVSALFPKKDDIDLLERFALSVGLSVAVVPLIGYGLNFTPSGIRLAPLIVSVSLFTCGAILAAHYRRARCTEEERFEVPFREMAAEVRKEFTPTGSRTDRILTTVLILALLFAIGTTIFVIAVPKPGEHFSEFYLLGANMKAADYPDRVAVGKEYPVYIGIGNHEYRTIPYRIEAYGVIPESDAATGSSRIAAMDLLWQNEASLAHNETIIIPYNLSVPDTGYTRIEFLLFNETRPGPDVVGQDRIAASSRNLHLWVTVLQP